MPLPVPAEPDAMLNQRSLLVADQAQVGVVVTVTFATPPFGAIVGVAGLTVYLHVDAEVA